MTFNSYGPRLRAERFYGRVVCKFILQSLKGEDFTLFGNRSQTKSFRYVTDSVSALLSQMGNESEAAMFSSSGARTRRR